MSLSDQVLKIIQDANSISHEPILDKVNRDLLNVIESRSNTDSYLSDIIKDMRSIVSNLKIEDIKEKVRFFNLYSEASIYLNLSSRLFIERVPETSEKRPDFKITFRNKEYFVEIKSLSSVDVFHKAKQSQEESLQGHIDLEDQLKKGKKFASTILVEQPYLKSNKEYNPYGRKHVVERIIEKIRQNIKLGQYKLGDSILVVDLGHLMMPDDPKLAALPVFYDHHSKSCESGILWHVAFGKPGMQIFKPNEGHRSNIDGILEYEGILIEYSECIRGIVFLVRELNKNEMVGLFRNKDADIDFEELMSEISPICNNEFNSNECFLLKD